MHCGSVAAAELVAESAALSARSSPHSAFLDSLHFPWLVPSLTPNLCNTLSPFRSQISLFAIRCKVFTRCHGVRARLLYSLRPTRYSRSTEDSDQQCSNSSPIPPRLLSAPAQLALGILLTWHSIMCFTPSERTVLNHNPVQSHHLKTNRDVKDKIHPEQQALSEGANPERAPISITLAYVSGLALFLCYAAYLKSKSGGIRY